MIDTQERVFRSYAELEAHYFPELARRRREEEIARHPEKYGTGLIPDLLKEIREDLIKRGLLPAKQEGEA